MGSTFSAARKPELGQGGVGGAGTGWGAAPPANPGAWNTGGAAAQAQIGGFGGGGGAAWQQQQQQPQFGQQGTELERSPFTSNSPKIVLNC